MFTFDDMLHLLNVKGSHLAAKIFSSQDTNRKYGSPCRDGHCSRYFTISSRVFKAIFQPFVAGFRISQQFSGNRTFAGVNRTELNQS